MAFKHPERSYDPYRDDPLLSNRAQKESEGARMREDALAAKAAEAAKQQRAVPRYEVEGVTFNQATALKQQENYDEGLLRDPGAADMVGKAQRVQTCAAMPPEGYEAQRKALLDRLQWQLKESAESYADYEGRARACRDRYDQIQRAINIISVYTHFELLSELLKLGVL